MPIQEPIRDDGLDDKVETLRILAFNKTSRICESNTFYYGDVLGGNTLRHPINKGEYDFVFLAKNLIIQL